MGKPIQNTVACVLMLVVFNSNICAYASSSSLLKQGSAGDIVTQLQIKLQEYGYYSDVIDGIFGSETKAAVMEFQGDEGLKADGVVEDQTWRALQDFNPATVSRGLSQSRSGQQLVVFAKRYLGTPYVWGGASPSGFDCSGFIVYVFKQFGVQLPRMADEQFEVGSSVARADLQPGDMVFFTTYEPGPSHVGIYIGGGQFLHASSAVGEVTVTPLSKEYYQERYLGARRVLR